MIFRNISFTDDIRAITVGHIPRLSYHRNIMVSSVLKFDAEMILSLISWIWYFGLSHFLTMLEFLLPGYRTSGILCDLFWNWMLVLMSQIWYFGISHLLMIIEQQKLALSLGKSTLGIQWAIIFILRNTGTTFAMSFYLFCYDWWVLILEMFTCNSSSA